MIADSAALTLFNNAELKEKDFIRRGGAVSLTQDGRKTVIGVFERRMDTLITHPLFQYSISYRRIFTRYEKLARRLMAYLHSASTLIWLDRNVSEPY